MLVFTTVDAGVYIDRYEHGERSMRDDFFIVFAPFFVGLYLIVSLFSPFFFIAFVLQHNFNYTKQRCLS